MRVLPQVSIIIMVMRIGWDLRDIARAFGGNANSIHTQRTTNKDVLWGGFFGFFEGPNIARMHSRSQSLSVGGVEASVRADRKSLLGVTLGREGIYAGMQYTSRQDAHCSECLCHQNGRQR